MRLPLALLATVSLGMDMAACGNSRRDAGPVSHASSPTSATSDVASAQGHPKVDSDNDSDSNNDDYGYGKAASAADKRAVTVLVRHYYTTAAAGDGAKACTMIYSIFAEEIPEVYGEPPGPPALRGSTCAAVMSKLFKQQHHQLVADLAELKVTDVRVRARHALVLLGFKTMPPRAIRVHRERSVWKIDALLDTGVG